jgi:hypothetical protein
MEAIYDPNEKFDFEKLMLTPPSSVLGGNHFIKFIINENPLYIQTPKCRIKQGMIKTAKKVYCDLMFTIENEPFIQWIENLENYCQNYIFTKRDKWFETNLEKDDIENSFTSSLKLFKSGKFYTLRIHLPTVLGKPGIKVYDENENTVEIDSIEEDRNIISIIEIQGIKCSVRGFQIEMEMKQLLLLKKENLFDKCILIKKTATQSVEADVTNYDDISGNLPEVALREEMQENETITDPLSVPCGVPHEHEDAVEPAAKPDTETNLEGGEPTVVDTSIEILKEQEDNPELFEVEFDLEKMPVENTVTIKKRNDVFYEMYKEAMKKAKMAKDLALSSYLEAKRIKNTHMLEEISDESDFDEDSLNFSEDD